MNSPKRIVEQAQQVDLNRKNFKVPQAERALVQAVRIIYMQRMVIINTYTGMVKNE